MKPAQIPTPLKTKPLLTVLGGETLTPPPIWLMRQAGRYLPEYRATRAKAPDFLSVCFNPDLASEITLQPIKRFGFDAAILFSDILVIPHALGRHVEFREGEGPALAPLESPRGLAALSEEESMVPLAPVFETIRRVKAALPADTTLIGFAGAPWTVATYMVEGGSSRDFSRVKSWALGDPDGFQVLIDRLVDATSAYLIRQIDAGAEVLQLFDSWAGVLPAPAFQRWCVAPVREIVLRLKKLRPLVPIIGFPRGAGLGYQGFASATGVDCLGLDSTVPLHWAAQALQPQATLQGNLDPIQLLAGGGNLKTEILRIVGALGRGPFIFNLGHGILPKTPIAHVEDLVTTVRSRS
ncbi:MAG: uroporphyrinogen decarboxylase [Rhodospirillaceae bacterium]|nr:uroporphyrinogen decarboxylase [Rhodospirillaceae bacterium]